MTNFNRFTQRSDIPLMVDFWAPWCGSCQTMSVTFKNVAKVLVCYLHAQPVPQIGIKQPALVPAVLAAICTLLLAPTLAPPVAFCAGVLGRLLRMI
jgi:uncharacterized membrane protein